jgi:hypothetical protein
MMRPRRFGPAPPALAALLLVSALTLGSGGPAPTFESYWEDGRAELSGYRYHVMRYGEAREGQAVMITVTEPFSESKRVKVDDPSKNPADTFEAVKMNLVRDFQTGIYDYNTMTSVFVRSRDFSPVKVSFASSEWCGNVYEEIQVDPGAVRQTLRSYFEGESGERSLARPPSGVLEDQLFVLLRGLRGDFLRPGERRTVALLPSSVGRRLAHRPLAWVNAAIARSPKPERVTVAAGAFSADLYRVTTADARTGSFWVEHAYPHRIVRWSWAGGAAQGRKGSEATESAELAGSARLRYWELHGNGQETFLRQLGLLPLPTPGPGR